jgi:hypothetical protein
VAGAAQRPADNGGAVQVRACERSPRVWPPTPAETILPLPWPQRRRPPKVTPMPRGCHLRPRTGWQRLAASGGAGQWQPPQQPAAVAAVPHLWQHPQPRRLPHPHPHPHPHAASCSVDYLVPGRLQASLLPPGQVARFRRGLLPLSSGQHRATRDRTVTASTRRRTASSVAPGLDPLARRRRCRCHC